MTNALANRAERFEKGKLLRERAPREAHADLHGPLDRDAVAILAESDANRVPELLPERYKRMTENLLRFCAARPRSWRATLRTSQPPAPQSKAVATVI
jgi:hypothetical protein